MKPLGLNEIRELFLNFYEKKGHYRNESFSLIPKNDKSLLIINSGMAPMKPYFAGIVEPPALRMTTCQKCLRTADIENVGKTSRHGTFFEMLGSFSFGDYFKEESIKWGFEFITEVLEMPIDRLWISVYKEDLETYDIWLNQIGFPKERIVKLGKEDNYWEIGTGPCGPCSEIYYDMGEDFSCNSPDCKPGCDCDRYVEFWNHVFTQYNNLGDGTYTELDKKNIDTGMGLERIACIMQGVDSIFEVDTLSLTLHAVEEISGVKYSFGNNSHDISIRIITDHIRAASFLISDGVVPSNEGRGYVLRRLIRRAISHGRKLGINQLFLNQLSKTVVDTCGGAYTSLQEKADYIAKTIEIEENKFNKTLSQGLKMIENYILELKKNNEKTLSGIKAFKLHDTYGFPIDITEEILLESGFQVEGLEFEKEMDRQKALSKADVSNNDYGWEKNKIKISEHMKKTDFVGYDSLETHSHVTGILIDGELSKVCESSVSAEALLILDQTTFYATSGGQEGDVGEIIGSNGSAKVSAVYKEGDVFIHHLSHIIGEIKLGDLVKVQVCSKVRKATASNHTATHLLHGALRQVLGDHVEQAGSKVDSQSLRFDFQHYQAMTDEEIEKVELLVNEIIYQEIPVEIEEIPYSLAKEQGAIGLFQKQYGDKVRVITIGTHSKELCGGTHVNNSGLLGGFVIKSETGIAGGVRRIEAITRSSVLDELQNFKKLISSVSSELKTTQENILDKIISIKQENKDIKKELTDIKQSTLKDSYAGLVENSTIIDGFNIVDKVFKEATIDELRGIVDQLKGTLENMIFVFATKKDGKGTFLVALGEDSVGRGLHAGKIVKELANIAGGGGGGKANMAQAGTKNIDKIDEAMSKVNSIIKNQIL